VEQATHRTEVWERTTDGAPAGLIGPTQLRHSGKTPEEERLMTDAFYVGAIGSRRNNDARRQRMIEHLDKTEEELERLRGPIGIFIGSKTPAEIAVSIMAEVLAVKNGVPLPRDMDVAYAKNTQEIAHNDPGVLVCGIRP
jgi:xanthine dehydrogenase accessory factor